MHSILQKIGTAKESPEGKKMSPQSGGGPGPSPQTGVVAEIGIEGNKKDLWDKGVTLPDSVREFAPATRFLGTM
jgi:hypothetical protein